MLVSFDEVLSLADKGGFAIPAFNVYNMETVMGIIAGAEYALKNTITRITGMVLL